MWSLRVISQAGLTWPSSNRSCAREGARHPGCTPCSSSGGDPLPRPSHYARLTRRAGPRARRAPPSTPVASAAAASSPGLSRLASTSAPLSWVLTRCISLCFASCIPSCISDRATSPVWPLTLQPHPLQSFALSRHPSTVPHSSTGGHARDLQLGAWNAHHHLQVFAPMAKP